MARQFILQFDRRFCMGHRLASGLAPKCAVPHGHNETVTIDIVSIDDGFQELDPMSNMVAEFGVIKEKLFRWIDKHVDHSFHLSQTDPLLDYFAKHEPKTWRRCLVTPGDPTTEILAACFMSKANAFLYGLGLECDRIAIQETPTNTVVFTGSTESILPQGDYWWERVDMSINEFGED